MDNPRADTAETEQARGSTQGWLHFCVVNPSQTSETRDSMVPVPGWARSVGPGELRR
jgi:hypothetical protein